MKYWNVLYKTICCTLALGASCLISAGGAWGSNNTYDAPQLCLEQNNAKSDVPAVKSQATNAPGVWKLRGGQDGANCAIHVYKPDPEVNCKHLSIKPNPSINCKILTFGKGSKDAIDGPSVSREANLPAKAWNSGPSDKSPNSSGTKNVHSDRDEPRSK